MNKHKHLGDAIKALDDYRVGGYLVRFTAPDDTDLHGEYFSKETDFWIEKGYPIKGDRILLEHGLDDFAKVMPVGIIDLLQEDDIGLYVEGRLYDRAKYEEMLESMAKRGIRMSPSDIQRKAVLAEKAVRAIVETGKVQWSSGALPQSVVIEDNHIKSWAIIEGSLTFTPAEPNGTEIAPLKSAFTELSELMNIPKQENTVTDAQHREPSISFDVSGIPSDVAVTWAISNVKSELNEGNKNMEEMLAQILAMLQEMASKMGMGEEETLEAVASVGEEMRADMQDEEMKQMDEEEMAKAISEKAFASFTARVEKWRKAQNTAKDTLTQKFAAYQKDALPNPQAFAGGKSNRRPQISVGDLQKYAHLSGHDMALGVKLALSTASTWEKRGMTVGKMIEKGIFSEEYMKVMAHKMVDEFAEFKPRDGMARGDQLAVKSAYPFKADDINATDITGFGLEWVELQYDTTLWERARDRTDLFNMLAQKGMEVKTVPQGANGLNIKLNTSSGTVYTMPESNDLDATGRPEVVAGITQFGTSEVEQPLATHVLAHSVTMQLEEDSIINVLSWLPNEMTQTLAESLENALINGDETTTTNNNINLYDSTPGTGLTRPDYLAWDGLRHEFLVDNTSYGRSAGGSLALTDYEETKNLFPSAIKNRRQNMLFIIDEKTESTTRRFPELLTFGVAGNQATIYSGDLPPLFGVPVYMSGFLELAASTGKNSATGSNNTRGTIICVYAPYWVYGRKREIVIEQDRNSLSQTTTFVATVRHLFKSRGAGAAAGTYNAGTY